MLIMNNLELLVDSFVCQTTAITRQPRIVPICLVGFLCVNAAPQTVL